MNAWYLPQHHKGAKLARNAASNIAATHLRPRRAGRAHTACFSTAQFEPRVTAILGMQWGDEGKGKLVDVLSQQYEFICRGQGGANAGHTIYDDDGNKYALHLVPSGILNKGAMNIIGNGVVCHIPGLLDELKTLKGKGVDYEERILISDRAHILLDLHKQIDQYREKKKTGKIGTTGRGIGPAYASKKTRNSLRMCDLIGPEESFKQKMRALSEEAKEHYPEIPYDVEKDIQLYLDVYRPAVLPYITDTVSFIHDVDNSNKRILLEGANATMLDIDFGTYPYVTSSNPSIGGMLTGLGLPPQSLGAVVGVVKAYSTRVGDGPYPTECLTDEGEIDSVGEHLGRVGHEFGTTTGRPRRCGWLDIVAVNYANRINGVTHINLTKLDVMTGLKKILIGVEYVKGGEGGKVLSSVPASCDDLAQCSVKYVEMEGWEEDISEVREFSALPAAAQQYVHKIEELTGLPVTWIGVGPGRDALIVK